MDCWTNYRRVAWATWSIPGLVPGKISPVSPKQLSPALGSDIIKALAQRSGLSEEEITKQLSQVLPGVVDKLTPAGRLPTLAELSDGLRPLR